MGRLAQVRGSGLRRDSSGCSRRCQPRSGPGAGEAAAVTPQPQAPWGAAPWAEELQRLSAVGSRAPQD